MSEEPPDDATGNSAIPGDTVLESRVRRRSFLTAVATASAGLLAGCSETGESTAPGTSPPETTYGYGGVPTTERPSTTQPTPGPTTTTGPGGDGTTGPGTTTTPGTTTPDDDGSTPGSGAGSGSGGTGGTGGSNGGNGGTGSGGSSGGSGGAGFSGGNGTGTPEVPTVESGEAVTRHLGRGGTAWVALGATAPASLAATARRTEGTEAFAVTLYGPDGSLLAHEFVDGSTTTLRTRAQQTGAQYCRLSNLGTTEIECVLTVETSKPRPLSAGGPDESDGDDAFDVTTLTVGDPVTETVSARSTGWYRVDFDADVLASITASTTAADGSFALSLYEPDGGLLDHRSTTDGGLSVAAQTNAAGGHLVRLSNTSAESLSVRVEADTERPEGGEVPATTTSSPTTTASPTTAQPTSTSTTTEATTTAATATTTSGGSGDDGGLAQLGYGMGGYGGATN